MGVPFSVSECFPSRGFRDTVNISSRRYHVGMCDGISMRGTIRRGRRRHALCCGEEAEDVFAGQGKKIGPPAVGGPYPVGSRTW